MAVKKGLYSGASETGGKKSKVSGKKKTRNVTTSLETLQKIKNPVALNTVVQKEHGTTTQATSANLVIFPRNL